MLSAQFPERIRESVSVGGREGVYEQERLCKGVSVCEGGSDYVSV